MTVAINPVTIQDGPLPEGDMFAYSYDPITSSVYLVKKVNTLTDMQNGQVLVTPQLTDSADSAVFSLTNVAGIAI
jgi:hypothetical protein